MTPFTIFIFTLPIFFPLTVFVFTSFLSSLLQPYPIPVLFPLFSDFFLSPLSLSSPPLPFLPQHTVIECHRGLSLTDVRVLKMFVLSLQGKFFYITPGICPSLNTMRAIVESAGGKLLSRQPSFRKIMEHKQNKVLPPLLSPSPLIPYNTLYKIVVV